MPPRGDFPLILIVLVLLAFLIILLLGKLWRNGGGKKRGRGGEGLFGMPGDSDLIVAGVEDRTRPCPLCGSRLKRGETVHTKVFPGKPDRLAHVYGCPYCYEPGYTEKRYCPVCHKGLPKEGYIIARMFERSDRVHVHVLGCTECRSRR
jgi:hypothetical protein